MPLQATVTSTTDCPGCLGGLVAVILVEDWIVAVLADALPKETLAAAPKPVPVIVTVSPPASDPWLGETLVTVGTAHDEGVGEATFVCGVGAGVVAGGGLAVAGRRVGAVGGGLVVAATATHAGEVDSPPSPCVGQAIDVPLLRTGLGGSGRAPLMLGIPPGAIPGGSTGGGAPREATMGADVLSCGAGSANVRRPWLAINATVGIATTLIAAAASTATPVIK